MMYLEPRELFDRAIVGYTVVGGEEVVVYSDIEIVELLCQEDGMTLDEAWEYYDFNIAGAYLGPDTPLYLSHTSSHEDE